VTAGPPVAVAVVSWNTRELLGALLESLAGDVHAGLAEVHVVDNASSDGSAAMVRERFGWAQLEALEHNVGYGPAVNRVARRTTTPFLAPANSDLVLAPGALRTLLDAARRAPHAGAFAPRLVLPDGTTQHSVHPFPTLPRLLAFNLGLTTVVPGLGDRLGIEGRWSPEAERDVDWAHGAFLLVRRTAWEAAGGFDDDQWLYAEDLDLGWRLHRAAWPTRYVPSAHVRHEVSAATAQAFGDARVERAQAATYVWLARRRGPLRPRAAAATSVAGALARLAWLTPAARIAPERFAGRRAAVRRWVGIHRRTGLARRPATPPR
jgi:N-acetylglucosaminyl-diphospho-decaprenol L-rhamnosyltransferase